MSPEQQKSIVDYLLQLLPTVLLIAGLVPLYLKRQMAINQAAQEERIEAEKSARKRAELEAKSEREAAAEQRRQFSRMVDASIEREKSNQQWQDATVKALTHQVEHSVKLMELYEAGNKELRANTNITTEGVEAIGELADNVRGLSDKVDGMDKQLVTIIGYRTEDKAEISKHETLLNEIITHLNVLLRQAEGTLQDVRKSTGESQAVGTA